jgi:hypothetical protein
MEIDVAASRLIKILATMANESRAVLSYGALDDEARTRVAIDKLRGLHAKLSTIDITVRQSLEQLPQTMQLPIHDYVSDIKRAEVFISAWNRRYQELVAFDILIKTSAGRQRVLDYVIPAEWDFQCDIFVLTHENELSFVPEIAARGQNRILAIGMHVDEEINSLGTVSFAKTGDEIRKYFREIPNPRPARLSTLIRNGSEADNTLWYTVKHAFTLLLSDKVTVEAFGKTWLTQGLRNMKSIAHGMNMVAIKEKLKGLPVVIVSPGPSLDKNIHLLQQFKGRAIIMAAAQCAKALQKIDLIPDFIVIADPGNLVYFLDGVDTSKVGALIAGVSCNPRFYEKPFKNIISFNANASIDRWISNVFNDTIALASAGSVSIDCFLLAKYIESSAIIMIGLDLALSGGSTYSSQSANSESMAIVDERKKTIQFANVPQSMEQVFLDKGTSSEDTVEKLHTLPGYFGGTVFTRPNYYLFYNEFIELASQEASLENPIPLVNCTEGGAYIPGFQHIPLNEAIVQYRSENSINVEQLLAESKKAVDFKWREKQYKDFSRSIEKELKITLEMIKRCRELSKKSATSGSAFNALNKMEKRLIRQLGKLPFISLPNFEMTQRAIQISNDVTNLKEANGVASIIYEAIEKTSLEVLDIINELNI